MQVYIYIYCNSSKTTTQLNADGSSPLEEGAKVSTQLRDLGDAQVKISFNMKISKRLCHHFQLCPNVFGIEHSATKYLNHGFWESFHNHMDHHHRFW